MTCLYVHQYAVPSLRARGLYVLTGLYKVDRLLSMIRNVANAVLFRQKSVQQALVDQIILDNLCDRLSRSHT